MKKLFTFLLSACMCTLLMAERPTGVIQKALDGTPTIDGQIDDLWENVTKFNLDKKFRTEEPTFGDEGTTYWKMLWDEAGLYILVVANDDAWFPFWALGGGANGWEYDKVELYFDTNYILADGVGGQGGATGNRQIAPDSNATHIAGEAQTTTVQGGDVIWALNVTDPTWTVEYFIPWESIPDKDGVLFDKVAQMGFDVTLIDRDPGDEARKRAQWANEGAIDENWNNMDDAGYLTFDGAEAGVYVDGITINPGSITTDNGTLQLTAVIDPVDATNQKLKWTIEEGGTGKASINSNTGVLTAIGDGTVMVKAAATDGGWAESAVVEITISGQVIDQNDIWNSLNKISNWNFDAGMTGDFPTSWGGWIDVAGMAEGALVPAIEDGVVVMKVGLAGDGNNWHYQVNQSNLTCELNVPYVFRFKSWASADGTPCVVDFEDTPALNYNRYGATTDPESGDGRSEWHYTVGTDPTWFNFNVVFDQVQETSVQKVQYMHSLSNETIYMDSVLLIKADDYAVSSKKLAANSLKVYPNPVGSANQLNVNLASAGGKVAIYNAIGQKLIEKIATTNVVKFDVANLRKGMYFVRLSDGTTQKFIR